MNAPSRCIPFADVNGISVGGKVEGLATLIELGLLVPDGFVILNPTPDALPDDLEQAYDRLGRGRVAVRSSASDEDGTAVSFAGQHTTMLDVEGMPALRDAVKHCIDSLASENAQAYRKKRADSTQATMSVIVQRMVDARSAGAIFTADPTTARRDRIVVEAVKGTGDALMAGAVTADHFTLDRNGTVVKSELLGSERCIGDDELRTLSSDALRIEQRLATPVDCEWAIDREGAIVWLQARPITTLPADPRELDDELNPDYVYVRCNIAEAFPGVATPLTISTARRAMDEGGKRMLSATSSMCGNRQKDTPWAKRYTRKPFIYVMQFGYPFLNVSGMSSSTRSRAGPDEAISAMGICGHPIPDVVPGPRAPRSECVRNYYRFYRFMFLVRHNAKLEQLITSIDLTPGANAGETYIKIDRELPKLSEAYFMFTGTTLAMGHLLGALPTMLMRSGVPPEQLGAKVAEFFTGTEDVETYDIAEGINRIIGTLGEHDGAQLGRFVTLDADEAHRFMQHEASVQAQQEYGAYFKRHGHHGMREHEMREKEWAEDPTPIAESVASGIRALRAGHMRPPKGKEASVPPELDGVLKLARYYISYRETGKSLYVMLVTLFKRAYRALARQMVDEGLLPDADLAYFLQHAELGELLRDRDPRLVEQAFARRAVLPYQEKLFFNRINPGTIEPIDPPHPSGEGIVHGASASLGIVRGRARVMQTPTEVSTVQPDEILIAPVIDIGWTPTFATIAGFVSEIGSAISHGAVVAREYGLPLIVNATGATTTFRTGDLVELDANQGVVRRIREE
jgi:phosphohistidine swiveling domain-containing protein